MVMQLQQFVRTVNAETDDRLLLQEAEVAMMELLDGHVDEDRAFHAPVMQAVAYHFNSGGRRIRASLALETAQCLRLPKRDCITLAVASELVHNASLIHDDIQDQDTLRRGVETVWSKYGKNTAICTGDFLLSAAYAALAAYSVQRITPKLIRLAHSCITDAIHGQCEDLAVRGRPMVSFAEYEKIAVAKSGSLLAMPLGLAFVAADHGSWVATAKRAAEALAIGYQIIDDIADVSIDAAQGTRVHSLNAVLALQYEGYGVDAQDIALQRAVEHLGSAIVMAEALPSNSGGPLIAIANKLRAAARQ